MQTLTFTTLTNVDSYYANQGRLRVEVRICQTGMCSFIAFREPTLGTECVTAVKVKVTSTIKETKNFPAYFMCHFTRTRR